MIDTIHYRDEFGRLIAEEPMIFSRLHDVDETLVLDSVKYRVVRVALASNVQHVNMRVL